MNKFVNSQVYFSLIHEAGIGFPALEIWTRGSSGSGEPASSSSEFWIVVRSGRVCESLVRTDSGEAQLRATVISLSHPVLLVMGKCVIL